MNGRIKESQIGIHRLRGKDNGDQAEGKSCNRNHGGSDRKARRIGGRHGFGSVPFLDGDQVDGKVSNDGLLLVSLGTRPHPHAGIVDGRLLGMDQDVLGINVGHEGEGGGGIDGRWAA